MRTLYIYCATDLRRGLTRVGMLTFLRACKSSEHDVSNLVRMGETDMVACQDLAIMPFAVEPYHKLHMTAVWHDAPK